MELIRATIAVHGKYHAFRLAEGLDARGVLDKIYTLYPRFKLGSYKLPKNKIKSFWPLAGVKYANQKLHLGIPDDAITGFFDFLVSLVLKRPAEKWIFNGYSGYCERSIKKAKALGAVTLVERGCPHIDEQQRLMREEESLLLKKEIPEKKNKVWDRMKREYEFADYVVVPSNYSKKSFVERGFPSSKILVTPLSNEKRVTYREKSANTSREFTVLCVGGNFYRKGIFYLLEAWKKLGLTGAKLIVKGGIPKEFEHLLVGQKNLHIIDRHLSDKEIDELYGEADMFVLPSIDDGFGLVVIEAMAAGLPVLITENVGAADLMRDGREGFVVPIRDPGALAEKIKFLYENKDKRIEMGRNARETSREYSPEKYADRVITAYRNIFANR